MKKHIISLFFGIFLVFKIPFFTEGSSVKGIVLKEVLSIGSAEDDLLYQWAGVATDLKGNIYVTDSIDCSIKKFSKEGILLKKAGRKGRGPGEFETVRLIKYFNKAIYVIDQFIPGISIFDEELNFKGKIPIMVPVADMKVIDEDSIAISTLSIEKSFYILIFDRKGKIKRKIEYFKSDDVKKNMLGMIKFETDERENFYIVYSFQDKVEKLDRNGKKLWSLSLFNNKKVKMKKPERGFFELPQEVVYKDIEIDREGNIFVLGGSFSKNNSRDVHVIDQNGKYLTTFTLPDTSHCIHIDHESNIFSRANMGITLKKYKLIYKN